MPDSVKVIVVERNGVDLEDQEEFNLIPENIPFSSAGVVADNVRDAITETNGIAVSQRYPILLQHNGTVSNGTFLGYSSLIPGDATPIVVPANGDLKEFTFSNANDNADYTLEFRKNTTAGTAFYTVSKTNTQFFVDTTIDESFVAGDRVFVKYVDNGNNASDATMVLYLLNDGV